MIFQAQAGTSGKSVDVDPTPSQLNVHWPSDISLNGQEKKSQKFGGQSFPKQSDGRSFQLKWTEKYDWIEYSKINDKVYCYACRQFGIGTANDIFTTTGFNGWKRALTAGQGFQKHEASSFHINAMLSWKQQIIRKNTNQEVSTLLSTNILEKRQYYFKSIVGVILFLVKNELPFRGDWDENEGKEFGLFNNLFEYTMLKDEYLKECHKIMPANALYTSPKIQNEVINIIADELRKLIVADLNSATYLTLLSDGTKDRNGDEIISIAFRYVKDSKPMEVLVDFQKTDDLTASGLSNVIIDRIQTLQINDDKIISQCYDGAPVMSGDHGGVQKLIEEHYQRIIPYVHCCNHRFHLVVEAVAEKVNSCKLFFGEIRLLHNFFRKFNVRKQYSGTSIPRLIETRWSGHLYATQSVAKNFQAIFSTLEHVKNSNDKSIEPASVALAAGLYNSMKSQKFMFMMHFLNRLLSTIEPANQILQKRDIGFREAMPVIDAVFNSVKNFRTDESFDNFIECMKVTQISIENFDLNTRPQRLLQRSLRLNDSVITDSFGETQPQNENISLKSPYFEVLDYTLNEMKNRFHNNSEMLLAISELNNINSTNFDINSLEPLTDIGISLPSDAELKVVQTFLLSQKQKPENENKTTLELLFNVKDAFPATYKLFEAADTFGSSTAICECAFSALNRIDTVKRMSMKDKRLRDLSLLAFEKKRLSFIIEDQVLRIFAEKNRRIQFF